MQRSKLLKADFHMHTHFSRDSVISPERMVARCQQMGLNCIAVTDHNTMEGALAVQRIAPFMVVLGEEVGTSEGEIIGLFLKEPVPRGLSPLETVKRIKDQGGLVSIPHPFDRLRRQVISQRALEDVLPYVDIIEVFNSRNTFQADNRKAREFAERHHLVGAGVSDAHTVGELGHTCVEMPEFDGTPEGLMRSLAQGRIVGRPSSPLVHVTTTFIKLKRRLLGQRRR